MEVLSIFLNQILSESARRNASVLFLTMGNRPTMKIEGELLAMENEEMIAGDTLTGILDFLLSEDEKVEFRKNKELMTIKIFGNSFRYKVNVFLERGLPSFSFYYLSPVIKDINSLNLPPSLLAAINKNSGLVVIAGAFGSGKTSIATAFVEEINKNQKKNIMTIEDPIEYIFVNKKSIVNQRAVGSDVPDVVSALDYCLEEDVDVVYINKIKDNFDKAISKILELASGNSLVFLEINAENATNVLQRIINSSSKNNEAEVLRYNLADSLLAIIAQRLVPKVGGGLIEAREIVLANSAVKTLIREGKIQQLESVIQTSRQTGMISMEKALEDLNREGLISEDSMRK